MKKCCACGEEFEDDKAVCTQSMLGAATLNYCKACAFVGAEDKEIVSELVGAPENCADWVTVYDKESDWYVKYRTNLPIDSVYARKTRTELNELLNS